MTLEQAILNSLPGTGAEISTQVNRMKDVVNSSHCTPNIIYQYLGKNKKKLNVGVKIIDKNGRKLTYWYKKD